MFGPQTRIKIKFSKEKQQYNSLMSDSLAMLSHQFKTLDIIDDGQEEEDEVEEDNGEEEISFDSVGAPPGLEKVFFSLVEMVEYPLFYSALLSKLNIGCPRGTTTVQLYL